MAKYRLPLAAFAVPMVKSLEAAATHNFTPGSLMSTEDVNDDLSPAQDRKITEHSQYLLARTKATCAASTKSVTRKSKTCTLTEDQVFNHDLYHVFSWQSAGLLGHLKICHSRLNDQPRRQEIPRPQSNTQRQ